MPDAGTIPLWVWIVAAALAVVLAAGVVGWFVWGRTWLARRYLISLVQRRESVRASRRTLEAVARHLAEEPDESLIEFASDPSQVDRRALVETRDRMWVVADELDTMPLPKRLIRVAQELADAAFVIAEEASRISDDMDFDQVLEGLTKIDIQRVETQSVEADRWIDEACAEYGVTETAVYGGGLYI